MFVVIEGADFAGKSSVADQVEALLCVSNIRVRRSQTCLVRGPFHALAGVAHRLPGQNEALKSFAFHAAYLSDAFLWRNPPRSVVLQESYILRVLARDIAENRQLGLRMMRLFWRRVPRPDLAYFLECTFDDRRDRYLKANGSDNIRDNARFGAYADRHKAHSDQLRTLTTLAGYTEFDTGQMAPEIVATEIVKDILRLFTPGKSDEG